MLYSAFLLVRRLVTTKRISVSTERHAEALDITDKIAEVVQQSKIQNGVAVVFTTHTTTGLFINERESGLIQDIETVLAQIVPAAGGYLHDRVDDNAASHIQSILLATSVAIPVESGRLVLGTWQSVFLAERDGPRRRTVIVTVIGE